MSAASSSSSHASKQSSSAPAIDPSLRFRKAQLQRGARPSSSSVPLGDNLIKHIHFSPWNAFDGYARDARSGSAATLQKMERDGGRPLREIRVASEGITKGTKDLKYATETQMRDLYEKAGSLAVIIATGSLKQPGAKYEEQTVLVHESLKRNGGHRVTPDGVIWKEKPHGKEKEFPIVSVENKYAYLDLFNGSGMPRADEVAQYYNQIFKYEELNVGLKNAVSQAILQGLHTTTGFCVLYTYNQAVFMSLDMPDTSSKRAGVYVQASVSQVYTCEDSTNTLHALIAISLQGLRERNEKSKSLENCYTAIVKKQPHAVPSSSRASSSSASTSKTTKK